MKKVVYITLFVVLGILVQFIFHALIEISAARMLLSDFEASNLGLSWEQWFIVHHVGAILLLVVGVYLGYTHGKYWWGVVYE